jgi:TOTE conflict system, Archaeo-Eukaryotic Primase domain
MRKPSAIPLQAVRDYGRLFVNRRAYTLQSARPHPETGRHYYFRPSDKRIGASLELTEDIIRRHLEGKITVGLYAINPDNQCCKWVAVDADYKNAMEDLLKLQYRLGQDGVQPALEMSRRGGHLWIFLETPLLARDCRIYIQDVALRLGVPVKGWGLREGIEIFPKHDLIEPGGFGNAIRGPLGIHRGATRRFWFYGADYRVEAQIAYLNGLRKFTEQELQAFIAGKDGPNQDNAPRSRIAGSTYRRAGACRSEFRILEHVGPVRRIGRNYVTRCPSCAEAGHDRSGDNLAILIEDPRFYQCWAGCGKEAIRAALGCPIRATEVHPAQEVTS